MGKMKKNLRGCFLDVTFVCYIACMLCMYVMLLAVHEITRHFWAAYGYIKFCIELRKATNFIYLFYFASNV